MGFPVNIAKLVRTTFLTEHLQWLLLKLVQYITRFSFFINISLDSKSAFHKNSLIF